MGGLFISSNGASKESCAAPARVSLSSHSGFNVFVPFPCQAYLLPLLLEGKGDQLVVRERSKACALLGAHWYPQATGK